MSWHPSAGRNLRTATDQHAHEETTMAAPTPELDERFGDAPEPVTWAQVEQTLEQAEIFWVTTTRADGQPHVTPLIAPYLDGHLWFCTGEREQKAKNLAHSSKVTMLTADGNRFAEGFDVAVEAEAVRVTDDARLRELAAAWEDKYGEEWHFDVADGAFTSEEGGPAHVYRLDPSKVLAFSRNPYSQTRFRF
jgi:general stress protein 26